MFGHNDIRALYIDFDGTICVDRYWRSLPTKMHANLQGLLFGDDRTIFNEWMRGEHTAEEINRYVSQELAIPYDFLWNIFVNDCKSQQVSQKLLDSLHSLRHTYKTVLMTGNMDSFSRFTVPALHLEDYFDYISNSFYERLHKADNDGELFKKYSELLGVSLPNSLLIDDSSHCCEIFSRLGGKTYQTNSPEDTYKFLLTL